MTHVAICIPSGEMVHAEFALSLAAIVGSTRVAKISLWNQRSAVLPESRNRLVRDALKAKATHLLWLDSDMVVPPFALDRLLAHREPIVGATYAKRAPPHEIVGRAPLDQSDVPAGLTAMHYMGFGCVLIDASVFVAVPGPWFDLDLRAEPQVHEDRWFFREAIACGYRVLCDDWLTTQLGHIGSTVHRIEAEASA
ncbi:MAG: hypothetical protein JO055_07570 [Alphaproteobacteria bacterium]|nr:hypothetical protein [Alphaproteobacteria bacterium]